MPAASKTPQLQQLQAEFKPEEHKTRSAGRGGELTYIDIANTILRVNSVLGLGWSVQPGSRTTVNPLKKVDGEGNERFSYMAFTELYIEATIDGVTKLLYGVGAMEGTDPDMAVKTALAEAFKKAWHSVGVALYLWNDGSLKRIEAQAALAKKTPAQLKREVFAIAKARLDKDKPSLADIGTLFGVKPGDLSDAETIRGILTAEAAA